MPRVVTWSGLWVWAFVVIALSGCAFDISQVTRTPTNFRDASGPGWTLRQAESIDVGSGFSTRLRQGTKWRLAGHVPQGDVYRTDDQIVTVEASNIYEAMVVVRDDKLVGFYLPVEHSFVAASNAILLPMERGPQ